MQEKEKAMLSEIRLMILSAVKQTVAAVIQGIKILVVYILPSALVSFLLSDELNAWLKVSISSQELGIAVNFLLVAVATMVKKRLPEESTLKKIL